VFLYIEKLLNASKFVGIIKTPDATLNATIFCKELKSTVLYS